MCFTSVPSLPVLRKTELMEESASHRNDAQQSGCVAETLPMFTVKQVLQSAVETIDSFFTSF